MSGFIKLHRSLINWEWYDDHNVKMVFIHCLLMANYRDKQYRGNLIKRGTFVTSRSKLAEQLGLSVQNIRTAISKLESTSELTSFKSSKGLVIQVINYDKYQSLTSELTDNQPVTNQQLTTTKNIKNNKEVKNINIPFEDFWNLYDKKVGNKQTIKKKWNKLTNQEREEAMEYIPKYKQVTPDKQYRKNPDTWLNQRGWEHELIGYESEPDKAEVIKKDIVDGYNYSRKLEPHHKDYVKTWEQFYKMFPKESKEALETRLNG